MSSKSNELTITLPREQWKALLDAIPISDMTYTPQGETLFAAYQTIEHDLDPDKPDQVAT